MNKRIRELRKSLDMTQTDFAQAIGLTQNTITLIETGKRNISDFSVRNICREFHVNEELAKKWLANGAQVTDAVGKIFKLAGIEK